MCAPSTEPSKLCDSRKNQAPGKEVCRFFSRKGWCKYGSSCRFQHGEPAVKTKQSEQEIEVEKHREGMQEIRTMIVSMCNEHNSQMADRAREIVKLRDELEGMKIRASKSERRVDRLHSAVRSVAFAVISYVAICASITLYPQHHDSIKQGAQVMPMMPINPAWKRLGGGIRATTGDRVV